ncbi:hypothetical protein [Alicyclobacillus dauci]|uniref:Uncharacterized protein n=1 Tax=Alicyclobacillus dauci TaxID=1475485 RepID=A0ABY6Z8Z5_9BACL|nr:hypothetical protein [Alicyclobacillus dauci]WAH38636.1 hypothetical protein NZD86_09200 [Alicyclobacillus dauci]
MRRYGVRIEEAARIFNLNDPTERAMYELSKRTNFSGLVKQYLARELKKQTKPVESSLKVQLGGD